MYWTESMGRLSLNMTMRQAQAASHPGPCDSDVLALTQEPAIRRQTAKWAPDVLRAALREYGAWEDAELADHAQNIQRMVWLAACDIREGV